MAYDFGKSLPTEADEPKIIFFHFDVMAATSVFGNLQKPK